MFCVRLSVSRIMLFDFSSINIPLAKKNTSHQSFFICHTVWLVCWNFYVIVTTTPLLQVTFPNPSQGKNRVGWVSNSYSKSNALRTLYRCAKYVYIYYMYTHYYNCIYALLVPMCILDHLSVYVCFLPELAVLGTSGWTSQYHRPHDRHIWPLPPTNRMENGMNLSLSEWDSSPKKQGKQKEQLTVYNHKNCWQHPTAQLGVSGSKNPRKTAPGAIPGATTRARTNFFQRRVALRQLCKASSKCATKARIISETYTSWLSWRSWLSWLLTF